MESVFAIFVGHEKFKPNMHAPFEIKGIVYATDAYSLVKAEKSYCDFEIKNPERTVNVEGIIPIQSCNDLVTIEHESFDVLKTEDEYTFLGEDVDCETCEGDGTVEWEFEGYSKYFDCPVCDGSGLSSEKQGIKTGLKTFGKASVMLNNSRFAVRLFYKLLKVRDILGGVITMIHQSGESDPVLFRIGHCDILLMPMSPSSYDYYDSVLSIESIPI